MDDLTREFLIESQEGLDRMEHCLKELEAAPWPCSCASTSPSSVDGISASRVQILLLSEGTDIASDVVQRASSGRFHRIEINRGLPARHSVRFFDHTGEAWTAKSNIRKLCNFRQANLCAPMLPFQKRFDVIFLRNVMLYFSHETRLKLMANVRRLLVTEGYLFLGSAEQPADPSL